MGEVEFYVSPVPDVSEIQPPDGIGKGHVTPYVTPIPEPEDEPEPDPEEVARLLREKERSEHAEFCRLDREKSRRWQEEQRALLKDRKRAAKSVEPTSNEGQD